MPVKSNTNLETGFFGATLALLITIPLGYFFSSLFFGVWFAYCMFWIFKIKHFKINKRLAPFFLFTVFMLISVLWSQYEGNLNSKLLRQLPLFLIALAGLFLPKINNTTFFKYLNYFANYLALLALVLFTIALFKYLKYQYLDFLFYHSLGTPFDLNATYLSYMVSIAIIHKVVNWKLSVVNITVLSVLTLFLLLLSTRNAIAITALILFCLFVFKRKSLFLKITVIISTSLLITISILYFKPLTSRFSNIFNTSYSDIFETTRFKTGRVYTSLEARLLQIRAYTEIVDTPFEYVFGLGLTGSEKKLEEVHKTLNTPVRFQTYNFHNQYLQTLSEMGFIGLMLLIVLLYFGVLESLKKPTLLAFMIVSSVLFISESILWRQRGILFFGILYIIPFLFIKNNESKKQVSKI